MSERPDPSAPPGDRDAPDADPDPIARLPPGPRDALTRLVAAARERQRRDVQRAIDAALTHVPALVRGPIRRLLFS